MSTLTCGAIFDVRQYLTTILRTSDRSDCSLIKPCVRPAFIENIEVHAHVLQSSSIRVVPWYHQAKVQIDLPAMNAFTA